MLPSLTRGDVMLRFALITCLTAFAVPSQVFAQQPKAEIGTLFGLSHLRDDWGDLTRVQLPKALSVWLIPIEVMAIGAEIGFESYDTDANLLLTGKVAFSPIIPSIYVLGTGSLNYTHTDSYNRSDIKGGMGIGLRARIGSALVLRMEGRYERWFEDEVNEFSLLLGFGTQLGE